MKPQFPQPQNATAARRLKRAYEHQFGHRCDLCEERSFRRIRCHACFLLVCKLCIRVTDKGRGGPLCKECVK
jgi:hypothetical protein